MLQWTPQHRVAGRLRAKHRAGRTITVRVRFTKMRAVTRSLTLAEPVCATLRLTEIAEQEPASWSRWSGAGRW